MPQPPSPSIAENLEALMRRREDKVSIKDAIEDIETHQGLALTRRDGLAMLAGLVLLGAAVTGIVWGLHAARLGVHHLFR